MAPNCTRWRLYGQVTRVPFVGERIGDLPLTEIESTVTSEVPTDRDTKGVSRISTLEKAATSLFRDKCDSVLDLGAKAKMSTKLSAKTTGISYASRSIARYFTPSVSCCRRSDGRHSLFCSGLSDGPNTNRRPRWRSVQRSRHSESYGSKPSPQHQRSFGCWWEYRRSHWP